TVPDTLLDSADELILVDVTADELLARLKAGKVYVPQQAERATENFFRKGNLIALRELALRQTADRVDAQMRDYREDHAIREIWQVGERILVCVGPDAVAEQLVRSGKRLATGLRGEWIVVYVETPRLQRLPAEKRDMVLNVLRLAEQLGAETMTLSAPEIGETIINLAKERNITKIMMGKPTRRGWERWLLGSVVDTIVGQAHNINVQMMGSARAGTDESKISVLHRAPPPGLRPDQGKKRKSAYRNYGFATGIVALCSLVATGLDGRFELANLIMVYLLGVTFVSTQFGRGPSLWASILSVFAFDLWFVKPAFSLSVSHTQYFVTLAAMLTVAMVISNLMANVRSQAKVATHRERRAAVLYAMSKELSASRGESEILKISIRQLHLEFGSRNVILFPDENGRIVHPHATRLPESACRSDLTVAQWVFDHNEMAGLGTNTLAAAEAVYFPLGISSKPIGVLAMLPVNLRRIFLPEQKKLLETFISLIVQAIERTRFAEQAKRSSVEMEAERLRNSLLSSISHDLRTPLATIVGSASTLAESDAALGPEDRLELSHAILDEALRMTNLVNNILDMARLDSGMVRLNRQWVPLDEIIGSVLTRL
ncbi:MAG: DUF4118 domain-containing protein, partial [Methylococcales bacterium]